VSLRIFLAGDPKGVRFGLFKNLGNDA
jgi:hypothetical protein